jgi:threonine/homoserine/homoserine lactone efflux protein
MLYYLFTGITLGLSAGFSPGPLMALVLSETIQHGKKAGFFVAMAPVLTDLPIILVSIFLITLLTSSDLAFGFLSVIGGIYLIWLAMQNFRIKGFRVNTSGEGKSLQKGIIVNFLNPAPYIFWISIGAPLILKGWDKNPLDPVFFLAGFYGCLIGSKIIIAILVGIYRTRIRDMTYRTINRMLGFLLILLAAKFFFDGFFYFRNTELL